MIDVVQKWTDESQKISKEGFDTALRSYGELTKGSQAIAAKVTDYLKKALEDATRAFEQLTASKSVDQTIEIQSQYAKKAYDTWVAEASKLCEIYVSIAHNVYKPVEQLVASKSIEQAIEIQSQYAKQAYDSWVAEASKLSETYVGIARDAYKPVEQAIAKKAPPRAAASVS